jgi:small subunit ribosomal protein S16
MAARIRLRRTGTTKRPSYRVVVADARTARDGRFIETIKIDAEKATAWLRKGALPSNTVRVLLTRAGVRAG